MKGNGQNLPSLSDIEIFWHHSNSSISVREQKIVSNFWYRKIQIQWPRWEDIC